MFVRGRAEVPDAPNRAALSDVMSIKVVTAPDRLLRALRRLGAVVALPLAVSLVLAATPANASTLHTVVQDDTLSLFSPQSLPRFTATLRWLGVDYLRVSAEWKLEAPDPDMAVTPTGFAAGSRIATDPAAYNSSGMLALDRAVRAATAAGLNVMVDPAFSAPLWATRSRPPSSTTGDPWYTTDINVRQLVDWETMLAHRYSGSYTPPGATAPLPRVAAFTLWNEPNGSGFLEPQWDGGVPVSADWYRQLVEEAYPAIKAAAPSATVLIGNTSDAGGDAESGRGGVPPLDWIRRLACVDAQLRPITTGACAHFTTIPADGYAHHPYERSAPPWVPSSSNEAGWAQMGDLGTLQSLLDRLVAMRRLTPGAANLWLTEQGYESNAQLRERPWGEQQQAQLNAEAELVASGDSQVASFSQFLLRDTLTSETLALRQRTADPRPELRGTWTTGLEREDGGAKPALAMFRSPIVARVTSVTRRVCTAPVGHTRGSITNVQLVTVWGRARPARSATSIRVQERAAGGAFLTAHTTTSDPIGIFRAQLAVPPGVQVRFQWLQGRSWQSSPAVTPAGQPS
jgi:hypothetical protein